MKLRHRLLVAALVAFVSACGPADQNPGEVDAGTDAGTDSQRSIHGGSIKADETWTKADSPHLVKEDVYVEENATLTIEAGAVVKFERNTGLYVGYSSGTGYLKARGTEDEPIIFTTALPNPEKGAWHYIWIENGGASSVLEHCVIEYAGAETGTYEAAIVLTGRNSRPSVTHTRIENSAGYGVFGEYWGSFTAFSNNVITGSGLNPIRMDTTSIGSLGEGNVLTGNGQDAIVSDGFRAMEASARWRNHGIPYRHVGDELYVDSEQNTTVLTLDPGVEIQFEEQTGLRVGYSGNGALYAVGTAEAPIVFRGMTNNENPGAWAGVEFYSGAVPGAENAPNSSVLRNVKIQHGGYDSLSSGTGALHLEESKPLLDNVTIERSEVALKLVGRETHGHPLSYFTGRVHFGTGENANTQDLLDDRS